MKKYTIFIVVLLGFVGLSCNRNQQVHQPIIFESSYHFQFGTTLIIGSDSQRIDSIFNKYFDLALRQVYVADSFGAYSTIRKYYINSNIEKTINNYLLEHHNPKWKCNNVRPLYYHYRFTCVNKQGILDHYCLITESYSNDKDTALVFLKGLEERIEGLTSCHEQCKLFLRDLKLSIKGEQLPLLPIQKKIFLEKFFETQLTSDQERLLRSVINLDEIHFVDK